MRQPRHEQAELFDTGLPATACPGAPAQNQPDRVRIRLRRGLRAIAPEPLRIGRRIFGAGTNR
jgi:hypothetical protein